MLFKSLLQACTLAFIGTAAAAIVPSPAIVTVAPLGQVASVLLENGDTRLFYQTSTLQIFQYVVHGPFTTGNAAVSSAVIVPAAETVSTTPITALTFGSGSSLEVHLYFFSPASKLSEYIWKASTGLWIGGASCGAACITDQGYQALVSSKLLYSVYDVSTIRLGFVSSGVPGTITEATKGSNGGVWLLANLPAVAA